MTIDKALEEQSEEFRLLYFQLIAFYDFLKENEGSKVRSSSWRSLSPSFSNYFNNRETSDSITREAKAKYAGSKKTSVMCQDLRNFFVDTNAICIDIDLRRGLAIYLTYWWGEAVFASGNGTHIRSHSIYLIYHMACGY